MRLSEAILLGSTMLRPVAGIRHTLDGGGGCALGMADSAIGEAVEAAYYPLLSQEIKKLPCGCKGTIMGSCCAYYDYAQYYRTVQTVIVHLFNWHVATKHDWTIERLAEWVASVERPGEACEMRAESAVGATESPEPISPNTALSVA